jgi:hypothetical protein
MKSLRGILCGAVAVMLLSTTVVRAQDVKTDYDHKANFGNYHTFSFYRVKTADPLFEQRVRDQITRDLQAKGLQPVSSGGDLAVTAIGGVTSQTEYHTFYDNLGGGFGWHHWGWWGGNAWGPGEATTTAEQIPIGTLMVDLYDTNTHELVFRGTARGEVSNKPDKNVSKVDKAIDKMFKDFPPKMS